MLSEHPLANAHTTCYRAAVYGGALSGLTIPYLQIQADGVLTGKFTLHAQTPTPASGTSSASRIIYKSGAGLKLMDAKAAFTDVLQTFTTAAKFDSGAAVTPDLPAASDWSGVPFTVTIGVPIQMNFAVAFVAEVSATRENQFKAQMGAFAKATSSVGLFVFSKIAGTCSAGAYLLGDFNGRVSSRRLQNGVRTSFERCFCIGVEHRGLHSSVGIRRYWFVLGKQLFGDHEARWPNFGIRLFLPHFDRNKR